MCALQSPDVIFTFNFLYSILALTSAESTIDADIQLFILSNLNDSLQLLSHAFESCVHMNNNYRLFPVV